jgi:hypothetical protein
MGAAAVLETAAETPPTVIASQHWHLVKFPHKPTEPSAPTEPGGNNDYEAAAEVDILKKSITKGGLWW